MCQTIPYNVYLYLIIMITNTYVKVYKENAQKACNIYIYNKHPNHGENVIEDFNRSHSHQPTSHSFVSPKQIMKRHKT